MSNEHQLQTRLLKSVEEQRLQLTIDNMQQNEWNQTNINLLQTEINQLNEKLKSLDNETEDAIITKAEQETMTEQVKTNSNLSVQSPKHIEYVFNSKFTTQDKATYTEQVKVPHYSYDAALTVSSETTTFQLLPQHSVENNLVQKDELNSEFVSQTTFEFQNLKQENKKLESIIAQMSSKLEQNHEKLEQKIETLNVI